MFAIENQHTLQYRISVLDTYSFATFLPLVRLLNLVRLLILLHFGTLVQLVYIIILLSNCLFLGIKSLVFLLDPGTIINVGIFLEFGTIIILPFFIGTIIQYSRVQEYDRDKTYSE